ncbi:MAG: hypothetical protein NVSMB6_10220 [Burkholderiaceae bacterium]
MADGTGLRLDISAGTGIAFFAVDLKARVSRSAWKKAALPGPNAMRGWSILSKAAADRLANPAAGTLQHDARAVDSAPRRVSPERVSASGQPSAYPFEGSAAARLGSGQMTCEPLKPARIGARGALRGLDVRALTRRLPSMLHGDTQKPPGFGRVRC